MYTYVYYISISSLFAINFVINVIERLEKMKMTVFRVQTPWSLFLHNLEIAYIQIF